MSARRRSRLARATLLFLPAAFLLAASPASAQAFALGAGGGIVNDTGSAENLKSFSTGAGYGFAEVALEEGLLLQARYTRMRLPPTAADGPDVDVDAATLSVAYLFKEAWWQAGFVAGGGGYWLRPKSPGEGQVATDPSASVFGWHGGLLTTFAVNQRVEVRLEAVGHLIRDVSRRKPIVISAAVAWKF